jgi:hypothetical protein
MMVEAGVPSGGNALIAGRDFQPAQPFPPEHHPAVGQTRRLGHPAAHVRAARFVWSHRSEYGHSGDLGHHVIRR